MRIRKTLVSVSVGMVLNAGTTGILPHIAFGEPPPARVPYADVLRAKHIEAGRVRARLIYARHIEAEHGCVRHILDAPAGKHGKHGKRGKHDAGESDIKMEEVQADVIYVEHLKTDWLEADEVSSEHINMGRCTLPERTSIY